jgi:hypothetical protein
VLEIDCLQTCRRDGRDPTIIPAAWSRLNRIGLEAPTMHLQGFQLPTRRRSYKPQNATSTQLPTHQWPPRCRYPLRLTLPVQLSRQSDSIASIFPSRQRNISNAIRTAGTNTLPCMSPDKYYPLPGGACPKRLHGSLIQRQSNCGVIEKPQILQQGHMIVPGKFLIPSEETQLSIF